MLTEFGSGILVACKLLLRSCGNTKLSRSDADDPLEVKGKLALVREADAKRDLRQAELVVSPQEVLRTRDLIGKAKPVMRAPTLAELQEIFVG
jgi:hypothetical protein